MKVIFGLGNPGPRYDRTRHNVGWWVADRLAYDWDFESFRQVGPALVTEGRVDGHELRLVKPSTYMNRGGAAVRLLDDSGDIEPARDLLVVVDDAALDVGRVRLRGSGSAGGHNGLKSVSGALGSDAYARLRVGVGRRPPGVDLSDWVLSPMPAEDEDVVVGLLPELTEGIEVWVKEGLDAAMNRVNR